MNKLKKQIFLTIYLSLTISLLSIIIVFTVQNYIQNYNTIKNTLNINHEKQNINPKETPKENPQNIKFVDTIMYTALLDENNNIKDIINHSNNQITTEEIKEIATKILNNQKENKIHIGFLYIETYSYNYNKNNELIILDNTATTKSLILSLYLSIIIFIILEIIIIIISKYITKKIVTPVKDSFEKQKQFITDASHELKTPLSVIIASADAEEENKGKTKWLQNIKYESDRMNNLITDLLELSNSEIKNKPKKEQNLSKITELSALALEAKAYEENVILEYNIKENINLNLDESSIKQLIEILLDNAIKHSYKNNKITINLEENEKYITLSVQNKGKPIPQGEEEKIFYRFYRVDKSRDRKENRYGLGLAIAKNIVQNHNGTISATSKNETTTFKVLFKK